MELGKIKGLWSYYKKGGIQEVLYRLSAYGYLPRLVLFLSSKHVLALDKINQHCLKHALGGYEFAWVDASSIDHLMACQGEAVDTPRAVFERFFKQGHQCYTACKDGKIIAYSWVFKGNYVLSFDRGERPLITLVLKDNEAFLGNGFIAEKYRLKGVFPHLLKFATGQYPDATRFFSSVDPINANSLRAHIRFGFVPIFNVRYLRIFSLNLFYGNKGLFSPLSLLGVGASRLELSRFNQPPVGSPETNFSKTFGG